jgi:hypothetical protein
VSAELSERLDRVEVMSQQPVLVIAKGGVQRRSESDACSSRIAQD